MSVYASSNDAACMTARTHEYALVHSLGLPCGVKLIEEPLPPPLALLLLLLLPAGNSSS